MEESCELYTREGSGAFMAALVLSLFDADRAIKEWGCKQDMIYCVGIWYFEVVFTLLTEVVAFHVRFTPIDLWGSSL